MLGAQRAAADGPGRCRGGHKMALCSGCREGWGGIGGGFWMVGMDVSEWWELLPAGIREQVDGYVLQDARLRAIRTVFEVGRGRGLGLTDAQRVVHDRYLHHGDRIARTPDSPLDLESLAALAVGCPGRVVAIEAV